MRVIGAVRAMCATISDRVGASETGAAAILVALLLPFVLGLSAIGLNYASLLNERRALITAVDAAALAAAGVHA